MTSDADIMTRLSPESRFSREDHLAPAFRTSVMIPRDDATAATVETQAAGETVERRSVVADDSSDDQRLDGMAVGTAHAHDMLSHEPRAFIVVALVAALLTAVGFSLCHR